MVNSAEAPVRDVGFSRPFHRRRHSIQSAVTGLGTGFTAVVGVCAIIDRVCPMYSLQGVARRLLRRLHPYDTFVFQVSCSPLPAQAN